MGSKKRYELQPGNEIRGFKIRLYPTRPQVEALRCLQEDCRTAWNWLVRQNDETYEARKAHAVHSKLVGPRPTPPVYEGLEPEAAKAAKESYIAECRKWSSDAWEATKNLAHCAYRKWTDILAHFGCKHDYQLLAKVIGWKRPGKEERFIVPGAYLLQSVWKNFMTKIPGQRRKKRKRLNYHIPLQVRSGDCFELGNFGTRRGAAFYDCRVRFNGLKIRGRLPGKIPEGRVLEGATITEEADGWWASIKQEVAIRVPPPAVPGSVVGIDVGLTFLAGMSGDLPDKIGSESEKVQGGVRVRNNRGREFGERIAGLQALADTSKTIEGQKSLRCRAARLHLQARRHNLHTIYNDIVKVVSNVETILVEKLCGDIGQRGSTKVSSMRKIVSLLKERYGDRVREVEPHYTSQDCSQCGHRSKESWSYDHGRIGKCPACGFSCDRDVNAARNIARREPIPLAALRQH